MPIAKVTQRGTTVEVYDERNRNLFSTIIGTERDDGLVSHTDKTVNIRYGNRLTTYDATGRILSHLIEQRKPKQ